MKSGTNSQAEVPVRKRPKTKKEWCILRIQTKLTTHAGYCGFLKCKYSSWLGDSFNELEHEDLISWNSNKVSIGNVTRKMKPNHYVRPWILSTLLISGTFSTSSEFLSIQILDLSLRKGVIRNIYFPLFLFFPFLAEQKIEKREMGTGK